MDPPRLNTANGGQAQIRATGLNLKRLLRGKPPRVRAKAGAKLVNGEFAYCAPTVPQAARVPLLFGGISSRSIKAVSAMNVVPIPSKIGALRELLFELLQEHERDGTIPTNARFLFLRRAR